MRKKTKGAATQGDLTQPPLVPMTEAETRTASETLARKLGELDEMEKRHAEEAKDHTAERKKLRAECSAIASTIRSHAR